MSNREYATVNEAELNSLDSRYEMLQKFWDELDCKGNERLLVTYAYVSAVIEYFMTSDVIDDETIKGFQKKAMDIIDG